MESSNICILGISYFLLLIWLLCWWGIRAWFISMSSSYSSKSVLLWTTCCVFGGGNIAGSAMRKVSLSFQQNWSHLIWSSFTKVIAVFVSVFCWFGLLGPDIPLYRNFRFPSSSKKTSKERRKRVLTPVGNCARKFPYTRISECPQKSPPEWLRKSWVLLLTPAGISELS